MEVQHPHTCHDAKQPWCIAFFHEPFMVNLTSTPPHVVLDVERVDVAAWKPEFLQ